MKMKKNTTSPEELQCLIGKYNSQSIGDLFNFHWFHLFNREYDQIYEASTWFQSHIVWWGLSELFIFLVSCVIVIVLCHVTNVTCVFRFPFFNVTSVFSSFIYSRYLCAVHVAYLFLCFANFALLCLCSSCVLCGQCFQYLDCPFLIPLRFSLAFIYNVTNYNILFLTWYVWCLTMLLVM